MFQAAKTQDGWRILLIENGDQRDVCGAIDEAVAWAQVAILNQMRSLK